MIWKPDSKVKPVTRHDDLKPWQTSVNKATGKGGKERTKGD
jgi:hypothetical protein